MALHYRVLSVSDGKVRVRFHDPEADFVHTRDVNACTDAEGEYDQAATRDRIKSIADGVAAKIAVGAIEDDRKAKPK